MSQVRSLRHWIAWHRSRTWHWQDAAGLSRTPTVRAEKRTDSLAYLAWIDRLWSHRRIIARRYALAHPLIGHRALWLCIHSREGAWHDPNPPYYGGLQMTYGWDGLVGNAALLSPAAQMRAAETGYKRSGYSVAWLEGQWPRTSPPCLGYR